MNPPDALIFDDRRANGPGVLDDQGHVLTVGELLNERLVDQVRPIAKAELAVVQEGVGLPLRSLKAAADRPVDTVRTARMVRDPVAASALP